MLTIFVISGIHLALVVVVVVTQLKTYPLFWCTCVEQTYLLRASLINEQKLERERATKTPRGAYFVHRKCARFPVLVVLEFQLRVRGGSKQCLTTSRAYTC